MHVKDNQPDPVDQTNAASGSEGTSDTKQVSYETYLKTLGEAKTAKARLKELEAAERERQEKVLEEQGEYKKLLSQRDEENRKLQEEISVSKRREADRLKLASVLNAAGGEIDDKWYSLIDYEDVVINPETGEVDKLSVSKVVENIKAKYPEIIKSASKPALPNAAPAGGAPSTIEYAVWKNLPAKEMSKWKRHQIIG